MTTAHSIMFIALFAQVAGAQSVQPQPDTYANFAALAAHERQGSDYSIALEDRSAATSVFAIHGGRIDLDTDLIAIPLAGPDWNLYVFKGLKLHGSWSLHVTSAHFDEPRAIALARKSAHCISIHGHHNDSLRLCIGGASTKLREHMKKALAGLPFDVLLLCPGLEGTSATNLVNECKVDGVQLEFSSALRRALFADPSLFNATLAAIRRGAVEP